MHRLLIAVVFCIIFVGCGRSVDEAQVAELDIVPQNQETETMADNSGAAVFSEAEYAATDVVARVDGQVLLYGDAQLEVDARLTPYLDEIPPEQMEMARAHMLQTVVEQFVKRRVLLDEAQRRKIEITPEEQTNAYRMIQESLPEGTTVEDIINNSPLGEARMREEVRAGLIIDKLLAGVMSNRVSTVSEEDIDAFIAEHREQLEMPATVHARHILFAVDADADEAKRSATIAEAESVREMLLEGADFAEIAQQHSSCPSKQRGGDLGVFRKGQMVKPFEEAAFTQELNEIGPLVETRFGYHIIQVLERSEAGAVPRDEVREMLKSRMIRDDVDTYIEELMQDAEIFMPEE